MKLWPFVRRSEYLRLQLVCIDRGSRLIDANNLIIKQASEISDLKKALATRAATIRRVIA